MDKLGFFTISLLVVLQLSFAQDVPVHSPSPSLGADSVTELAPTPERGSPDLAPTISPVMSASPPAPVAPSPLDLAQGDLPASSPAPSPGKASDMNHSNINADVGEENTGGDKGLSGGKKAGIVVAVVAAVCLVGLGALVYKKRQENISRAQYGYAARREIL